MYIYKLIHLQSFISMVTKSKFIYLFTKTRGELNIHTPDQPHILAQMHIHMNSYVHERVHTAKYITVYLRKVIKDSPEMM